MGDKRDAAMAGLPWPTTIRSATDPRASGPTPPNTISNSGTPIRHPDPADSDMTADDIGHESFSAPATAAPPPVYSYATSGTNPWFPPTTFNQHSDHSHYGPWTSNPATSYQLPDPNFSRERSRERTVHTIYFKIWDPDAPARSLYVVEINRNGFLRRFDAEYFFHKLTGDQHQANQMSDYWRSHYGLPMQHGGTPFQPTWTSSTTTQTPPTISAAAQQLATLLFGPQAASQSTSPTSTSSDPAPALTAPGTAATSNMPLEQLRQLVITLRDLSSSN